MKFLKLGRWCHPTSEYYKNNCNQLYKMALANSDCCSAHKLDIAKSKKVISDTIKSKPLKRDPLSQLLVSYYG